jgi:hypothetical protein
LLSFWFSQCLLWTDLLKIKNIILKVNSFNVNENFWQEFRFAQTGRFNLENYLKKYNTRCTSLHQSTALTALKVGCGRLVRFIGSSSHRYRFQVHSFIDESNNFLFFFNWFDWSLKINVHIILISDFYWDTNP